MHTSSQNIEGLEDEWETVRSFHNIEELTAYVSQHPNMSHIRAVFPREEFEDYQKYQEKVAQEQGDTDQSSNIVIPKIERRSSDRYVFVTLHDPQSHEMSLKGQMWVSLREYIVFRREVEKNSQTHIHFTEAGVANMHLVSNLPTELGEQTQGVHIKFVKEHTREDDESTIRFDCDVTKAVRCKVEVENRYPEDFEVSVDEMITISERIRALVLIDTEISRTEPETVIKVQRRRYSQRDEYVLDGYINLPKGSITAKAVENSLGETTDKLAHQLNVEIESYIEYYHNEKYQRRKGKR